ncbi:MAG: N-acetyltransferase [Deltaproteobacteria bacterium]
MIRKAKITDVNEIHAILTHFGQKGLLLPRSRSELYDQLRDFTVYETDEGHIAGCTALHICWEDLAEIRSLAVLEGHQGKGIGRRLVQECLSEAIAIGIYRVFTLTYQQGFFLRLGFRIVDKSLLPHKVWSDCIKCPKFPDCDETAMLMEI